MEKNTGKVREFCESGKVGTMQFYRHQANNQITETHTLKKKHGDIITGWLGKMFAQSPTHTLLPDALPQSG